MDVKSLRFVLTFAVLALALVPLAPAAQAGNSVDYYEHDCGVFTPSNVFLETFEDEYEYRVAVFFSVTDEEKAALACVGPYVDLRVEFDGFRGRIELDDDSHSIGTDLPVDFVYVGADRGADLTVQTYGTSVADLEVGYQYRLLVTVWGPNPGRSPSASVDWIPSYWTTAYDYGGSCDGADFVYYDVYDDVETEICTFENVVVSLSDDYNGGDPLPFDGYQSWP